MQRIDENTYIDDTLLTCAEYQLFINEIGGEGGYFVPTNWVSGSFAPGQARAAVVGVSGKDTQQFCDWLSKREIRDWRYRLPTSKEAKDYPLELSSQVPIGYWIQNEGWWGPEPFLIGSHSEGDGWLYNNLIEEIEHAISLANFLSDHLEKPDITAYPSGIPGAILSNINLALENSRKLNLYIAGDVEVVQKLAMTMVQHTDVVSAKKLSDTMNERIAGHLPYYFEGIRLVKERTK